MGSFTRLVLLSTLMLVSTLIASFTPLFISLSPRRISFISTYAVGLLVGAALTVVIPEGVDAVYKSQVGVEQLHGHHDGVDHHDDERELSSWVGGALLAGFILMYLIDSLNPHGSHPPPSSRAHNSPPNRAGMYRQHSSQSELEPLSSTITRDEFDFSASPNAQNSGDYDEERLRPVHKHDMHSHGGRASPNRGSSQQSDNLALVIGLLAHSLADGISLGASALPTPSRSLVVGGSGSANSTSIVIFAAILLHKAPTAFALASLLLPTSPPSFTRRALLAFSFASPVGALLTYSILSLFNAQGGDSMHFATGLAMVFSGGTFLFVATHVMKGVQNAQGSSASSSTPNSAGDHEGYEEDGSGENESGGKGLGRIATATLVLAGMITPGALGKLVGHGHGH